jgi:hypothetical protein
MPGPGGSRASGWARAAGAEKTQPLRGERQLLPRRREGIRDPATKAAPLIFSVPLTQFQPGQYTRQVSVLELAARTSAAWRGNMVLLP